MKAPVRRVTDYLTLGQVETSRPCHFELTAVCGHHFVVRVPPDRYGVVRPPIKAACVLCPLVPDAREHSYVEGGAIPKLRVAS
jgi:hypothetical protein